MWPQCAHPASVPTVGHPGGFTSGMFSPDRSSVPPFLWSSRAQCHWNPPWNPPILLKPLCPGFPRSGHSRAPGAHPGPQGPAGTRRGRAGTRCSSPGRVCAKAWHCLTKMFWALPELPVIAPGAKNLLPDKDAFLGATGRILRGTSFVLLDPQSHSCPGLGGGGGDRSWGGEGTPGGMHIPGFCKIWDMRAPGHRDGAVPCAHHSLPCCSKQSSVMLRMGTEAWLCRSLSPKMLTREGLLPGGSSQCLPAAERPHRRSCALPTSGISSPPLGLPTLPEPRGTGISCPQDPAAGMGRAFLGPFWCWGFSTEPILCWEGKPAPCPSVSPSSHPSLVMPPGNGGWGLVSFPRWEPGLHWVLWWPLVAQRGPSTCP